MKFENQKQFFGAIFALEQKRPWSLITVRSDLKSKFWALIPHGLTIEFAVATIFLFIGILGGSALLHIALAFKSIICLIFGIICFVFGGLAWRSLALSNDPDKRIYLNRKAWASKVATRLDVEIEAKENELASLQTKREETVSGGPALMLEMKHVQFIDDLIPYMSAEQLLKYLKDVQLPLRLKELDKQIEKSSEELVYLKEEKSFLTEVSESELKKWKPQYGI